MITGRRRGQTTFAIRSRLALFSGQPTLCPRAAPDLPGRPRQRQSTVLGPCHRRLEAAAAPATEKADMPPQDQIIDAVMARALQADAVRTHPAGGGGMPRAS